MAQFELNIYNEENEVVKTHTADFVRWGVYLQALELKDLMNKKSAVEQFESVNEFIKKIFPALTDEDLVNADADDVLNTFKQLIAKSQKLNINNPQKVGASLKNAAGAE